MILLQHYERYFWYYASNNSLMIQMNIYFGDISLLCSSDKNETFYIYITQYFFDFFF